MRVSEDGSPVADGDVDGVFYDETAVEERRERELMGERRVRGLGHTDTKADT